jgi:predicted phosphodiesterase
MARAWREHEIEFLTGQLGRSTKEVVLAFNEEFEDRTYDSIQKKVRSLRVALEEVQQESDGMEAFDDRIVAGNLKLPHVTNAEKREARQAADEWLKELVEYSEKEIGHISSVIASRAVRSDNTSLVVVLSDTHYGKYTDYFNLKVAQERMRSVPSSIFNSINPGIDEVVLVLAGDMVEGEDIYATQNNKLECPVFEQTQICAQSIWETVLLFRKLFDCRVRVETCPGNHGRMSKTANEKSNWDNVVYHILRLSAHMHKDPEIVINANFGNFITFPVKDKVGMAYHKGVKHDGTPAMQLKIAGWDKAKKFDFMVHGHWHRWHIGNWMGRLVVGNGCMCGPDDLSEEMAVDDNARQAYFFVTPEKPIWGFSFVEWETEPINTQ